MIVSEAHVVAFSVSGSGTIEVAAAPGAGYRNHLVGCSITLASLSTLQWLSAATAKTGVMVLSALDWDPLPVNKNGLPAVRTRIDCAADEALNLTVGSTATGIAYYVTTEVKP